MKKKLLVILGAGSSIPLEMPSVASLDHLMKKWAHEWAAEKPGCPDYFDALWMGVETYYHSATTTSSIRPQVNFEKVLGEMVALSHWMSPAPWGDTLRQAACQGASPPGLAFPCPDAYGPKILVTDQLSFLSGRLAEYMRDLCKSRDAAADMVQRYKMLLDGLRHAFDVGIFNLNYDNAALSAWPEAYTGFDGAGAFQPCVVHQRNDWNFIYHLHGSVHHSFTGPSSEQICWRRSLDEHFFDGNPGLPNDRRSDGRTFPKTTLIAGGYKLDQLLVEPFHSLHAALVRHCHTADAILIGGYGFGDVHVNRALRNRVTLPGTRPRVIVLAHAGTQAESMRMRRDLWAIELRDTFAANDWFFREPGGTWPRTPADLAKAGAFELETEHHVAIWYGGFVEAADHVTAITSWLDGGEDNILVPKA